MNTCVKHQQPIFKTPHTQIEPGLITVTLTGAQVAQIVAGLRAAMVDGGERVDAWQMAAEYLAACAAAAEALRWLGPGEVTAFQGQVARWQGLETPLAPGHV